MLRLPSPLIERLLTDLRTGQISRRTFLRRCAALGLADGTITFLLASCSEQTPPQTSKGTIELNWRCNQAYENSIDGQISFQFLADIFSRLNPGIHVTANQTDSYAIIDRLKANTPGTDIVSVDVVWVRLFAERGWIVPFPDLTPHDAPEKYLAKPLEIVTDKDKDGRDIIWAAPFFTDVGLLFYRTDLPEIKINSMQSWEHLQTMAQQAMKRYGGKQGPNTKLWGYVWQGVADEPLMCNLVEVLSGYGGQLFNNAHKPTAVVLNQAANQQALQQALETMVSWVGTISPKDVVQDSELQGKAHWFSGHAALLRGWPNTIYASNDTSKPAIFRKYDFAPLPGSQSCLGGWQLAITAQAAKDSEKYEAARKFINWMLSFEAQQYLAVKEGFMVTLQDVYKDPNVGQWNPYLLQVKRMIIDSNLITYRPLHRCYEKLSRPIERTINTALRGKINVKRALAILQGRLQKNLNCPPGKELYVRGEEQQEIEEDGLKDLYVPQ